MCTLNLTNDRDSTFKYYNGDTCGQAVSSFWPAAAAAYICFVWQLAAFVRSNVVTINIFSQLQTFCGNFVLS
jgi:hypothetical protein